MGLLLQSESDQNPVEPIGHQFTTSQQILHVQHKFLLVFILFDILRCMDMHSNINLHIIQEISHITSHSQ